MKRILAIVIALTMSVAMNATAALSNDELKIGISQEFENLNPLIMQMVATTYMYHMTGRTLDTIDGNGKWVPLIAKSIPSLDNKGAKLTTVNGKKTVVAVWEIKDKANWSDGKPVVCADFKLARDIAVSPNVSVGEKEVYAQVEKIEWDPATPKKCTFTYDKPRWDFYTLGTFYPLPAHIETTVFEQHGSQKEGYEKNSNYTKNPTMPGLSNGPYMVSELKLGSHVTFVPNPHFYGPAPKIKKIIVKLIPNTGTLEANLRSGTIDKISVLGITFDQALALDKKVQSEKLPYKVEFKPSLVYEHIDLNLDDPIMKDVRLRKALVYSINRDDLVKALFDGKQPVAIHSMAKMDPWYTDDPKKITLYKYDKKEAARLLDEAGWKLNAKDGYRYKDGKKLSLQFMTTAGNKARETVQVYLQNQWKNVGVEVTIKNEPGRVFFGETLKKRKFGQMAMFAWVSSPENNPRAQFHSKSIPSDANGWSGQNNGAWSNPEVDKLIDQLDTEFNGKKRLDLVHKITKYYTDEVPVIPLFYRTDISVPPTKLQNYRLMGHQFHETNEAELWEIK